MVTRKKNKSFSSVSLEWNFNRNNKPFRLLFWQCDFFWHKFYIIVILGDRAIWASNQKAAVFLCVYYVFPHALQVACTLLPVVMTQEWKQSQERFAHKPPEPWLRADFHCWQVTLGIGQYKYHWYCLLKGTFSCLLFPFFFFPLMKSVLLKAVSLAEGSVWLKIPIHLIGKIDRGYI